MQEGPLPPRARTLEHEMNRPLRIEGPAKLPPPERSELSPVLCPLMRRAGDERKLSARKGRPRKGVGWLKEYVEARLLEGWSHEQISGRLRLEGRAQVSHETT